MDFMGKIAVITGGASGLGRASALKFASGGAKVAIFDIDDEKGESVIKECMNKGTKGLFIHCDVTSETEVVEAYSQVVSTFGAVDILHINTGIIDKVTFVSELSFDDWKKVINVNLNGAFLTAKYGISQMLNQDKGVIVFTGSNWAYVCDPGFTSYAASKGGVVAFARALALDHAKDNIRINVICPGNMVTPLLERQLSLEDDPEAVLESMGQISTPEEVANLVAFLASDESSAMKGSAVIIDQGETLGYGHGLRVER
ncbi:MAG: SDR family oxidoreductase [Spirochaetales bacterium]|nr:SDR family oxidoreductase [Spirochaetales bacterium]